MGIRGEERSGTKYGVAERLRVGKETVKVVMDEDEYVFPIPDGITEELELPPAGTVLKNVKVAMSSGRDTLYSFSPAKGAHMVVFDRFSAAPDTDPQPKFVSAKPATNQRKWPIKEHYQYTALLRVVRGEFKGCLIPYTLYYLFQRDADGSAFVAGPKSQVAKNLKFLEICGMDLEQDTIKYSENVLPGLGMMLCEMSGDHVFQVTMKDGWVDEINELPAGFEITAEKPVKKEAPPADDEVEEDEGEEEPERVPVRRRGKAWEDEED